MAPLSRSYHLSPCSCGDTGTTYILSGYVYMIDDTETPVSIVSPAAFILAEVCVKELSYWHCVSLLKPVN